MKIVEYSDEYKEETFDCLKRNYEWMSKVDKDFLNNWLSPLLYNNWYMLPNKSNNNLLLLNDNNNVVGFIGMIYSKRKINNNYYIYGSPSTWAIDDKYRSYIITVFNYIHKSSDVIGDLTANSAIADICMKMYKYKNHSKEGRWFVPIPYFRKKTKIEKITNENQIDDIDIKKTYKDNSIGNVKLVKISGNDTCYVFYHKIKVKTKFIYAPWIEVLSVSNVQYFTDVFPYFNFVMFLKNRAFIKCDDYFFKKDELKHVFYFTTEINRLFWTKDRQDYINDLLYSELCLLDEGITTNI